MRKVILAACLTLLVAAGNANAASTLVGWNLAGKIGTEASDAATYQAANVNGEALTRGAGLTGSSGANSMNASGWNSQTTDYFQFGLTIGDGYKATLANLNIGTRSSATGPGTLGLYGSTDNFTTSTLLFTFAQAGTASGTGYLNSSVDLSSLANITGTYLFRVRQIGTVAANGGTTSTNGTFRITNYFNPSDTGSFDITGTIDQNATPTPVPAAAYLLSSGLLGLVGIRRRDRNP